MESGKVSFLQSVIDDSTLGVFVLEIDQRSGQVEDWSPLLVNRQFAAWSQQSKKSLLKRPIADLFTDTTRYKLIQRVEKSVEEEENLTFDQWIQFANIDKGRWFKVAILYKEEYVLVEFQEVLDQQIADVAEWNELKYKLLFDQSLDAIVVTDRHLRVVNANHSFRQLFEFDEQAVAEGTMAALFENEAQYQAFISSLKEQQLNEREVSMYTQSGTRKTCIVSANFITDEDQRAYYFFGIRDVTKRKQTETQLLRVEKLALTGKISRMIAHEVRNPLTNLHLALDQLKDEMKEQLDSAELYIDIIERNANRINALISDLLSSSKPQQLNLKHEPLEEVVLAALSMVEDRLKLRNMRVTHQFSDGYHSILLDRDQLKTAILNLFVNAVEAMKDGEGHLKVATKRKEDHVELRISDNGHGIKDEHLKQLFEPFFTGKKTGTGLGLTAVQNIINSHQGQIDVESRSGKGTTFIVTLPLQV